MNKDSFITILVAEDNDLSRDLMMSVLAARGYRVYGAIDGESAIKVVEERAVDLALVDINMAPKGGFEFVKYMTVKGLKIPVVIVTADDSTDVLLEANALGVTRILQKPVTPDRLVQTVERILQRLGIQRSTLGIEQHNTRFTPEQLMARAIEIADKNAQSRKGGPFGAVVADAEGRIVGEGMNGITSRIDPVAHAEVMAIRRAAEKMGRADLSDCTLYCSSEPTMMAKALIISVGIRTVHFGLSHAEIATIRAREDAVRGELERTRKPETAFVQTGHDAAMEMFRRWERLDGKVAD